MVSDLLREDDLLHIRHALAAVLLRPGGGHPALGGELRRELPREVPLVLRQLKRIEVPVLGKFRAQELADFRAKRFLFVGEAIVHGTDLLVVRNSSTE